jgi:hypothetical protein
VGPNGAVGDRTFDAPRPVGRRAIAFTRSGGRPRRAWIATDTPAYARRPSTPFACIVDRIRETIRLATT